MTPKNIHLVPPIIQDWAIDLASFENTPEVRENFALRFEAIRDFCNYALEAHEKRRKAVRVKGR